MRRIILIVAALSAALVLPAAAEPSGEQMQLISGTISVPNPTKAALNVTRHARSAGFLGSAANGVVSWFFKVDPSTVGGEFTLTTGAETDLDILFYSDPGSLSDAPTATREYIGSSGSGEAGVIPEGSTHAVIYPASGVDVPFAYRGHAPPVVELGLDDLDVTVAAGAMVRWVNRTGDYAFVDGGSAFSSGSGSGSGIPVGQTFSAILDYPGTYAYTTSVGSGVITVTG